MSTFMELHSGRFVDPIFLQASDVNIDDIAWSLSNQCRFNGHCKVFYSVAEHSIRVSRIVEEEYKLAALLHDAAEAYLGDIIRPIKSRWTDIYDIEYSCMKAIAEKFGLDNKWGSLVVNEADDIILATEARDLMRRSGEWHLGCEPLPDKIVPMSAREAYHKFLSEYTKLT